MPLCPTCGKRMTEHCLNSDRCGWAMCNPCGTETRLSDGKTVTPKIAKKET